MWQLTKNFLCMLRVQDRDTQPVWRRRKRKKKQAKNQKGKALFEEIKELQTKKKSLKSDMQALVKSADKYTLKAESTAQVTLIAKSNSLRHGAKEKKVELEKLEKQLSEKRLQFKSK